MGRGRFYAAALWGRRDLRDRPQSVSSATKECALEAKPLLDVRQSVFVAATPSDVPHDATRDQPWRCAYSWCAALVVFASAPPTSTACSDRSMTFCFSAPEG